MLTTGEQQELCQIEEDLRHADRGFAWRLTLLQGVLRCATAGRRAYLPALAVLTAVLLRLAAAAGRLLMALAEGAVLMEPAVLVALGGPAWTGWESGPKPGHGARPVPGRPQPGGTDLP
jgi:Protein of unknown function (DUF3040)